MPFIQAAKDFVNTPSNRSLQKFDIMKDTIEFLLNNAIGIRNAISTDRIIDYLRSKGHRIRRESWQIEILGYLREHDVFIGSKIAVGIFLIETENDAREAYNSIKRRVEAEEKRLKELGRLMRKEGWTI